MVNIFMKGDVEEIIANFAAAKVSNTSTLLPQGGLSGDGGYIAAKAAEQGHIATLDFLRLEGVDLGAEYSGRGVTGYPAHFAAANGRTTTLEYLKKEGVYLGQPDGTVFDRGQGKDIPRTPSALARLNGFEPLSKQIDAWVVEQDAAGIKARRPEFEVGAGQLLTQEA